MINLPLPEHLNHLMRLFEQFEVNFQIYRTRHDVWTTSMERMEHMIKGSLGRNFNENYFRQFMTIVPGFYLHKWEMIKGRLSLMVELPADAISQVENESLAMTPK